MTYKDPDQMREVTRAWRTAYWQIILMVLFLALALVPSARSQVVERQVINAMGGSSTSPILSFSVGEAVTSTRSNSGTMLTQGFQQNFKTYYVSVEEFTVSPAGISVYPNPARSSINLSFGNRLFEGGNLQLAIYNGSGQLMKQVDDAARNSDKVYELDISSLSPGIYYLSVANTQFQSNHKFIKTN